MISNVPSSIQVLFPRMTKCRGTEYLRVCPTTSERRPDFQPSAASSRSVAVSGSVGRALLTPRRPEYRGPVFPISAGGWTKTIARRACGDAGQAATVKVQPPMVLRRAEQTSELMRRRSLLLAASAIAVAASALLAVGLGVGWLGREVAPSYPALRVTNGALTLALRWTPSNIDNGEELFGTYVANTTAIENGSNAESSLEMEVKLSGDRVSSNGDIYLFFDAVVLGSFSSGVRPTAISTVASNDFPNSLPALTLWLLSGGMPGSSPVNLTSYDLGGPGSSIGGWGQVRNVTSLANRTETPQTRYFFELPFQVLFEAIQPEDGTTSEIQVLVQSTLTGLGHTVFCEFDVSVQVTIPD
jgi:hypothetical protein